MRVCTCLLLLRIFAQTNAKVRDNPADNERSVNLALETVLEFNNKDHSADIKFLDNVQTFIKRVKSVIDKNKQKNARRNIQLPNVETFTDFLQQLVYVLNTYEDAAFQDFFDILDEEIRKYHYRGCKFYELTENYEMRKTLAAKLDLIRGKSVFIIKTYINVLSDMLRDESYDKHVKDLIDYINSLYRQDAKDKFVEVIAELENYGQPKTKRKNTNNLVRIIRDALRSIIFDHYTNLNANARRELKHKIETFWQAHSPTKPDKKENSNVSEDNKTNSTTEIKKDVTKKHGAKKDVNKTEHANEGKKKKHYNKKTGNMRDGVKGEKKTSTTKVYTKLDTENYDQDNEISDTNSRINDEYFRTTKDDKSSRIFTSEELTGETLEKNSIENFQEQLKEANTQRYMTLYPEEITYKSLRDKSENPDKIVHRAAKRTTTTSTTSKFITLWVEEATGRIPQAILNRYTTKPRPKHKKKHKLSQEIKHSSKKPKHKPQKIKHSVKKSKHLRQNLEKKKHLHSKHREEEKKPVISRLMPKKKKEHEHMPKHGFIDVVSTAMELYEYKKMMGHSMIDKPDNTSIYTTTTKSVFSRAAAAATTKSMVKRFHRPYLSEATSRVPLKPTKIVQTPPSPPYKSALRLLMTAPIKDYINKYDVLTGGGKVEFRKSAPPPLKSYDGRSKDKFRKDKLNKSLRKSFNVTRSIPVAIDQNVIKRIRDLEMELNKVKSRMIDVAAAGAAKAATVKYAVKEPKLNNSERKEVNAIPLDLKRKDKVQLTGTVNKNLEHKTELRTENKKPEYQTEFKFVKDKDSVFREVTVKPQTDYPQTTEQDNKNANRDLSLSSYLENLNGKGLKYFNEKPKDYDRLSNEFLKHYNDLDEWKGAFMTKKQTTRSVTPNTPTINNTTRDNSTFKLTDSETTPSKVEIFIPVSFVTTTTPKPPVIAKKDALNTTANNIKSNIIIKTANNTLAAALNITKEARKQISMTNATLTTVKTVSVANATKVLTLVSAAPSFRVKKDAVPPISASKYNGTTALAYTDPIDRIDEGLAILL